MKGVTKIFRLHNPNRLVAGWMNDINQSEFMLFFSLMVRIPAYHKDDTFELSSSLRIYKEATFLH